MKPVRFHTINLRCRSFALFAFLVLACVSDVQAQTKTNPPPSGNRWLLIVETSKPMQRRAAAAQQIAASLVNTGMNGQMRAGDTLGLWTFNEALYAGKFPLQDWKPETAKEIAQKVFGFLGAQKNEKDGRLACITENLNQVVKASDLITIIVISEGASPIQGTPFDEQINDSFKEWQAQQKKSQMPFLTMLRAGHGQYTNYLVSTPPFAFEIPPLPPPPVKPKISEVKPVVAPRPTLPPLILSGKKPGIVSTQELVEVAEPTKPETNSQPVAPVVTSPPQTESNKTVELSSPVAFQPPSNSAPVAVEPIAPVVVAESEPVPASSNHKIIWVATGTLVVLVGVIGVLLRRRSRNSSGASLITRSLDRDQK